MRYLEMLNDLSGAGKVKTDWQKLREFQQANPAIYDRRFYDSGTPHILDRVGDSQVRTSKVDLRTEEEIMKDSYAKRAYYRDQGMGYSAPEIPKPVSHSSKETSEPKYLNRKNFNKVKRKVREAQKDLDTAERVIKYMSPYATGMYNWYKGKATYALAAAAIGGLTGYSFGNSNKTGRYN